MVLRSLGSSVGLTAAAVVAAALGVNGLCTETRPAVARPLATVASPTLALPATRSGNRRVLFVSDLASQVVFFTANINVKNPQPLGTISQGVTRADGLWVDKDGTLYVVNDAQPPSIAEYQRGSSAPFLTITNGLFAPQFAAVDSAGTLYVDDTSQGGVIVLVYPPGATSPSRTIGIPHRGRAGGPGALAFDKNGNLLVATFEAESEVANVYRIARGSSKAKNLKLQGLTGGALGTDKNGNIYAGGDEGAIAVYQPGSTSPARYIDAGTSGFYSSFAVSPDGTVYWPNYDLGEMFEFAPGASAPTNVFEGGGVDAAVGPW